LRPEPTLGDSATAAFAGESIAAVGSEHLAAGKPALRELVKTIIRVKRVTSAAELAHAFRIRLRVFVQEQGVPEEIELDRDDQRAIHYLAAVANHAAGTARIVLRHGDAKIGRMAVLKSYRRQGVGRKLLRRAVATAKKLGARKIYLHAQVPVVEFYEKLGFDCIGSVFDEAGIPHRKMILQRNRQDGAGKRRASTEISPNRKSGRQR